MKRYKEYKDSGVEWIGEIPSQWDIVDFRRCVNLKQGLQIAQDKRFETDGKNRYVYITVKYTNSSKKDVDTEYIEKPYKSVICDKDDVLLARTGATGKVITDVEGVFHNNFFKIIYDKQKITKEYLVYYLKQETIQNYLKLIAGTTTIPDLNHGVFLSTKVVLPNILEQNNICNYLDKKTSQIETLISKKEELIETLKSSRTKLISETVTKGLYKDVPMKDSGVEWIGEIPSHWDVSKVKYTTYVKGRIGWQGLRSDEFIDNGPFLVTGTDFKDGKIDWDSCYHIEDKRYNEAKQIQLKENDLLITKDGTIGKIALVTNKPEKASLNSGIFVTRPLENNLYTNDFMYWVLESNSFKQYIAINETGSTIKHLYQETFVNFDFMIPNKKEQQDIADYLNKKVNQIDALLSTVTEQIELLKKAKQKLITEVVTGKIDVTNL